MKCYIPVCAKSISLLLLSVSLYGQNNIFTNGDFEAGPLGQWGDVNSSSQFETSPGNANQIPGWQFITTQNAYGQANVVADQGKRYLVFQRGDGSGSHPGTSINSGWGKAFAPEVQGNRIYKLTAEVKAPGSEYAGGGAAGQNVSLTLEYRDGSFNQQINSKTVTYRTANNLQTIGFTTASPANAAYMRSLVVLPNANASVAISSMRFVDATFDVNRVVNGDFNGSLLGWKKTSSGGSVWYNATHGVDGSGVAHLRNTNNQTASMGLEQTAFVAVLPGEEGVMLTFDARKTSSDEKFLNVIIRQYDASGVLLSDVVSRDFNAGETLFQTFTVALPSLSESASFLDVEFTLDGSGPIVDYFIDNVNLYRPSIPEPSSMALGIVGLGMAFTLLRKRSASR